MRKYVSINSEAFEKWLDKVQTGARARVATPSDFRDVIEIIKKRLNVPNSRLYGTSGILNPLFSYNYIWKNYPHPVVTLVSGRFNRQGVFMVRDIWRGPSGEDRAYLNLSDYVKGVIIQRAQNI